MASRTVRTLDSLDWDILRELQADARLSYNELSRRVGLSSPSVAERVRRFEESGVITGYHTEVDPARIGLPIMALVEMRCDHNKYMLKTASPSDYPEILEVLKVSGEHCTVIKAVVSSTAHLEELTNRLGGMALSGRTWSGRLACHAGSSTGSKASRRSSRDTSGAKQCSVAHYYLGENGKLR